jgi:4-carboxymuconolactone decarboxylase
MATLTLRSALAASALWCALAAPVWAQDRMPPIPADKLTDAQKKASETFAEGRGYAVRGPFVPLLRSPEVMLRAKAMGDYLRFKSTLTSRLNEMVILITARAWTQNYEWHAHRELALKAGLRAEIADAIAQGFRPVGMAEDEEVAYDTATEILREKRVSDRTYGRAVAKFGEQGVIDLLGVVGYYNFLAIVMNATRTAMPPGVAEPLKRFPD